MKCETPAFASDSSREPAPIQKPIATERTWAIRSEITRSPESSSLRTYFCTGGSYWCAVEERDDPQVRDGRGRYAVGAMSAIALETVDLPSGPAPVRTPPAAVQSDATGS